MNEIEWRNASAEFRMEAQAACRALIAMGDGDRAGRAMGSCLSMGLVASQSGSGGAMRTSQAPLSFAFEGADLETCAALGRILGQSPAWSQEWRGSKSPERIMAALRICEEATRRERWEGSRVALFLNALADASEAGKEASDSIVDAMVNRCVFSMEAREWHCLDERAAEPFAKLWSAGWLRSFKAAPSGTEYHLKAMGAAYSGAAMAALKAMEDCRDDQELLDRELSAYKAKKNSFDLAGRLAEDRGLISAEENLAAQKPSMGISYSFRGAWGEADAKGRSLFFLENLTRELPKSWLENFSKSHEGERVASECEKALLVREAHPGQASRARPTL
jgi:hypothetical protein